MSSTPRLRLLLCLWPLVFSATNLAQKPGAKSSKPFEAPLPDAYSGVPYKMTIVGDFGLANGGKLSCPDPTPALPDGLKLSCALDIVVSGTATTAAAETVSSTAEITDVYKHVAKLHISFVLRPASDTVVIGGPPPPAASPAKSPPPPDFTSASFLQSAPIAEGASTLSGFITPAVGDSATKFNVRVWIEPDGASPYVAQLKPPSGSSGNSPLQQVALSSDSSYNASLISPLAAGESVHLSLVDATGKEVLRQPAIILSTAIDMPLGLRLEITSEVINGATAISGRVNMPVAPIKPDSSATPPTNGNFPQIVVHVKNPDADTWSIAPLVSGTGPATTLVQSVQLDGTFILTLKNALKSGQIVRIEAVPPPGRHFTFSGAFAGTDSSRTYTVRSSVVLVRPSLSTVLSEGVTVLTGTATAVGTGSAISVAVLDLGPGIAGSNATSDAIGCLTADNLSYGSDSQDPKLLPLTSSGSNVLLGTVDAQAGTFKVTLAEALKEGDRIQIVQVLPADTVIPPPQREKCRSTVYPVRYTFDWHRTNVVFVAGVLISNSSSGSTTANFSQANQFYSINVDHAWRLPGADCVLRGQQVPPTGYKFGRREYGMCTPPSSAESQAHSGWRASWFPGINSYFEGRLTAIPVSAAAANPSQQSTSSSGTAGSGTGSSGNAGGSATGSTSTILTSQKVFRVSSGAFLPWVITHGTDDHPSGLFIGPLAKAGFDTVTGAASQPNVVLPDGSLGTLAYQRAYNFFAFGARLGNMELSASPKRAPKLTHYLDVTIGRYSNLQSFICHQPKPNGTSNSLPGSTCTAEYPQYFKDQAQVVESRKALYRLDFEGLIKVPIPATLIPFYIGFNANIAQHTVGAAALDHGYAPPDDIRILFGTKIDIGSLLSSMNLGAH